MTTPPIPAEAITAAAKMIHNDVFNADHGGYSACSCTGQDEHDKKWHADVVATRQGLEAAAPLIRDHWAALLKAEIADEVTAIAAQALIDAEAASTARIAALEQVAAEMRATFHDTRKDGWRARAGQVQIQRWDTILAGEQ